MDRKENTEQRDTMEVVDDANLMGTIFILFLLLQIAWVLRPICGC